MSALPSTPVAFRWPEPPLEVALVRPEIPPNTGNIARLCAATGCPLHLVGPLGFQLTDRRLRRAGLDYWDAVTLVRHDDLDSFLAARAGRRLFLFSTRGQRLYTDVSYRPGDILVFGSEGHGLPAPLLAANEGHVLRLPMRPGKVRSLNLADTVAAALYEALRQVAANP